MDKNSIVPSNNNIVIEVTKLPVMEDGVYVGEGALGSKTASEYYYGKALKLGPIANAADQCPEIKENGVYDPSAGNPREADTQRGVVISCADGADQIEPGTIVAFDPYCGNLIVNEGDNKLKTVNSFDILFLIQD